MTDHKLVTVLAYCLREAIPGVRTVRIADNCIDLGPFEMIIPLETIKSSLSMGENEFLDQLNSLQALRRIRHTVLNGYARIELLNIRFPIGPTMEPIDPKDGVSVIKLSRWIEIEKENWAFSVKYLEMALIALNGLIKACGDLNLTEYQAIHCTQWMSWAKNRRTNKGTEVKASSVNDYLQALKASFRRAIPTYLQVDPFKKVKRFKVQEKRGRVPDPDEAAGILEALSAEWVRNVIEFALLTGLRRSEIVNLLEENADWERKEIFIQKTEHFSPKFGKERTVQINEEAMAVIVRAIEMKRKMLLESPYVFVDNSGKRILPDRITKLFKMGVRMSCKKQDLTFHDARRAFATQLDDKGIPLRIISHLLGHDNVKTTERYLCLQRDDVARAVESVSLRDFTNRSNREHSKRGALGGE